MKHNVALVTGASSGIGEATSTRLAAAGYTVYGTPGLVDAGLRRDSRLDVPLAASGGAAQ